MNQLLLVLFMISTVLIKINAEERCSINDNCPPPGTVCAVGESEKDPGNFCNEDKGDDKCKDHCEKTYGAELIKAECSAPRANNQRECVCQLKCQNGGCWGDPHCWSFDGTQFSYQSLKKYYVIKPLDRFPTLPHFEIIQSNHPFEGSAYSILDTLDLVVSDWGQLVEVVVPKAAGETFTLAVNRKPETIPFKYSEIKGHRESFIDIKFSDAEKQHLVITTSFGVQITIHCNEGGAYSDLSINIPRHPELKGATAGLLGRWNDNPADDNLDANGKPQTLDDDFSAAFGNSWLVPNEGLPSQCELDFAKAQHEKHVKKFTKEHLAQLRKMCEDNMHHAEIHHCMKQLGRPPHAINDCVLDLSHIADVADQNRFLEAKVKKFQHRCPHHALKFQHHHHEFKVELEKEHVWTKHRPQHRPQHGPEHSPQHGPQQGPHRRG